MRGDTHVRFGERSGETDRERSRHRAPGLLSDLPALGCWMLLIMLGDDY